MSQPNLCDLKSCFLCSSCLTEWVSVIGQERKNITVKKSQTLFKEGDPVTGMFFVYSGKLKVHKRWDHEKEIILRFAQRGDIVGHLGLGDEPAYPVSATAIEPVTVCYIPMAFFEATLNINHGFATKLMRFFANELHESEKRMRNFVHMPVKGRVAQALITLQKQFGVNNEGCINIELSRQDLASFSGTVYESLFRAVNELVAADLIKLIGKHIRILKEDALLEMIASENILIK
ncbi:Crp/Fnr family transcriptional regulator [Mucilaginibacter calamicampi]|uniref:Crp/Fnr family transcriptional regulator n=1 Tax=Mucilaginibacter calamicampi TaxID=1302352 RepID=A0ABW2YYE7_9SPHI